MLLTLLQQNNLSVPTPLVAATRPSGRLGGSKTELLVGALNPRNYVTGFKTELLTGSVNPRVTVGGSAGLRIGGGGGGGDATGRGVLTELLVGGVAPRGYVSLFTMLGGISATAYVAGTENSGTAKKVVEWVMQYRRKGRR